MSRLVRRVAAATALALTIPLGAAFGAPGTIGSVGIGDPYYPDYGNGGYDVSHYGIDIAYTPSSDTVAGTTTITATTTQALSRFDLDFVLPVSAVVVNGALATYHQTRHELVVRPATELVAGAGMRIEVTYKGVPSKVSDGRISPWIRTKDGAAAVGEPEIAAWWFPSDDHPRDKATYDVSVTVPRSLEVLSNGVLVSSDATTDRRTWHWREDIPMASYLADFVAGQFDITSTTHKGLPVVTAVASGGGAPARYAAKDLARTPQIIDFEQGLWGPYPFDAMGGVAPAADFGFALENQTRPVYSRLFWGNGSNIYVVVHELAHQWYGDSVSVENWRDIWLNEGFASFTEWMWSEKHGQGSAAKLFDATYRQHPAGSSFWKVPIGDPGAGREFVGAVYDRGAMTLQALRTRIGQADFFTTMRQWAATRAYSNGEIADFIALAEKVSGEDLGSFFQAWLYSPTRPAPTAANGFPAGSGARVGAAAAPVPASLARIQATDRMLAAQR